MSTLKQSVSEGNQVSISTKLKTVITLSLTHFLTQVTTSILAATKVHLGIYLYFLFTSI